MRRVALVVIGVGLVAGAAAALPRAEVESRDNVPMYINYQGYLTDTLGNPLSGTMQMAFAIFAESSGGSQLWSQAQTVIVRQGVFNVKLALTAGDTILFREGNRRWLELRVNGVILSPRTEITSMAYGIHSLKADNSDMVDGRHASELIWNTSSMQPNSGFYISYNGRAGRQLAADGTGLPGNSAAVLGTASGRNSGVYGSSTGWHGVFGHSGKDSAFGVCGYNTNARGSGVVGSGCGDTMVYLAQGSGGAFSAPNIGLFGYGGNSDGTGVGGTGNDLDSIYTIAGGSGGAFNGAGIGVYGLARNRTGNRCGGYFTVFGPTNETCFAYVAYRYNNISYKILGYGQVSTVMPTRAGQRILFAPESPVPVFEDYGEGRLSEGFCRIELDPLFLDCVAIDEAHPLRVTITLTDECNGVYVKPDLTGFDVRELNGGRSNASFQYRVVACQRGSEDLRLPAAPAPLSNVGHAVGRSATAVPTR